jgi:c-di-AMP phosphodiesterase-like protein
MRELEDKMFIQYHYNNHTDYYNIEWNLKQYENIQCKDDQRREELNQAIKQIMERFSKEHNIDLYKIVMLGYYEDIEYNLIHMILDISKEEFLILMKNKHHIKKDIIIEFFRHQGAG